LHHTIMKHLQMKFIGLQVRRKLPWVTSWELLGCIGFIDKTLIKVTLIYALNFFFVIILESWTIFKLLIFNFITNFQ
jgi:hypothetical protein